MMYLLNGLPAFFGTINITGNIIISGQGLFANGTNAAPSISFQSDPDTGVYLDAANTLGIATAGAGTVLFSSSAGIGKIKAHGTRVLALEAGTGNTNITITPSGSGNTIFSGSATVILGGYSSSSTTPCLYLGGLYNNSSYALLSDAANLSVNAISGYVSICSANSEKLRVFANGRVGIATGATDSGALLQIGASLATGIASAGLCLGGADTCLSRSAAGRLDFSGTGVAAPQFRMISNGGNGSSFYFDNTTLTLDAGGSVMRLQTSATTALTLDATQAATFSAAAAPGFVAKFNQVSGTNPALLLQESGVSKSQWSTFSGDVYFDSLTAGKSVVFRSGAQVTALTLDASQNAIFAGTVKPQLATTAGAPAYVKGAIYFDTTLNKLRVGGATAWETITSA